MLQWKQRWFTLSDEPGTMTILYYKHGGGVDLKGEILLDARHTSVREHSTKDRLHCFCIETLIQNGSTKTIYLSCDTSVDVDEWMDAIRLALANR
jgi:PH domain